MVVNNLPCFKDLIAVLFESFLIITLGYLSCRFKLISTQAKDLNSYLTTFALPMIIFLNIAQMEFKTINLSFILCMLSAKLLVFLVVSSLTLTISYPRNFGYAGSLSILSTQSNDFALGYPLIKSLYGDHRPEMLNYLSLMAPIQLLILNPLGIMMLEYHKSIQLKKANKNQRRARCTYCESKIAKVDPTKHVKENFNESSCQNESELGESYSFRPRRQSIHSPSTTKQVLRREAASVPQPIQSNPSNQPQRVRGLVLNMPNCSISPSGSEASISANLNDSLAADELGEYGFSPGGPKRSSSDSPISHGFGSTIPILHETTAMTHGPGSQSVIFGTQFFMKLNKKKKAEERSCKCKKAPSGIDLGFLKALATNPLIIASVVALVVNLTNGPELPRYVTRVSNTIAASFAAPALFVVGTSMYGKFELLLRNPNDLMLSSVLVLTKVLLLPNLMRTLTLTVVPSYTPIEEVPYLIDFSFLYGLLPTAPTACIIAKQYGVLPDVISISMLLSTFASAPLMLAASAIINPSNVIKLVDIERLISQTVKISSVITFSLAFLTIYAIWKTKDRLIYTSFITIPEATFRRMNNIKSDPTKIFLLLLAMSQAMIGLGGIMWCFIDSGSFQHSTASSMLDIEGDLSHPTKPPPYLGHLGTDLVTQSQINHIRLPLPISPPLSSMLTIDDPLPLHETVESWHVPHHLDFGLKTIFAAQYVFSSSGLMMSKFVILCIVLVVAAKQAKGPMVASKVSSLLTKVYILLGSTILLWLILDSDHLKHIAIEPSLPSENGALYVRLIFNVVFLCVSMPVFALIIREDNKRKVLRQVKKIPSNAQSGPAEMASGSSIATGSQRFLTSSDSISSGSSSAFTTNTNLELGVPNIASQGQPPPNEELNNNAELRNQFKTYSDDLQKETLKSERVLDMDSSMNNSYSSSYVRQPSGNDKQLMSDSNCNHQTKSHYQKQGDLEEDKSERDNTPLPLACKVQVETSEFNKYSILIVFMLIDSILNLTSITQKLIQDQPSGTFGQIEVISVALEFGQGLLTFLIYGMGRLLK